jgi:hypothetical protein
MRKSTKGALKKTTRKGAYKQGAKKNFRIRRAPLVETKSRTTEDCVDGTTFVNPITAETSIPKDDAFYNIDIMSFLCMEQGLAESEMIGQSVYSRYIKAKMEFTFPADANALLNPYRLTSFMDVLKTPWDYLVSLKVYHTDQQRMLLPIKLLKSLS